MDETHRATCFLRHRGAVLLLRRRDAPGSDGDRWGAVTGRVAESDSVAAARAAVAEATGSADACTLVRGGDPVSVPADRVADTRLLLHPFLFDCPSRTLRPDEPTVAHEWVAPPELRRRETAPGLWTAYDRVRPRVETVAEDRDHGAATLSVRGLAALRDEAALAGDRGEGWEAVAAVARHLRAARPAMTVVANRINRVLATADRTPAAVQRAAHAAIGAALDADAAAAATAADHVAGTRLVTLSRSGTVARAVADADPGPDQVLVGESRPGGEGVVVAERFADAGHDVALAPDAALAHELATADWDAVLVGADTVMPDGRVLNKVGTRGLALAAAHEGLPVYVAAATDKVSPGATTDAETVDPATVYDGDADLDVATALFDVTPADCVAGVVTEDGLLDRDEVAAVGTTHRERVDWE